MASKQKWSRKRLAEKAEHRERILAAQRRYRDAHKEELRERHRLRMLTDPAYREAVRAKRRRYRAAHKEELAERRRLKRLTDPEYREKQLERERVWRRRTYFREVYRISLADYDAMLALQHGACAICKRTPGKRLAVDHCHTTGKVRGLLCAKCNSGLAFFQDNPRYLAAATAYLQASRVNAQEPASAVAPCGSSWVCVATSGEDGGQPECDHEQHGSANHREQDGDI
jgi:hypothetical protein